MAQFYTRFSLQPQGFQALTLNDFCFAIHILIPVVPGMVLLLLYSLLVGKDTPEALQGPVLWFNTAVPKAGQITCSE